ncbi:MAG TPA: hypothetical protein VF183_03035 [Acidimicrobiales bacterium]
MQKHNAHHTHTSIYRRFAAPLAVGTAFALVAIGCSDDGTDSSTPRSVAIVSPVDGQQVPATFDVDLDVSIPIGEPDTGLNHVHIYYDGNTEEGEYGIAYDDTFTVEGLEPGQHTLEAVIANADHSVTDTRSGEITVEVADGGAMDGGAPGPTTATDGGDGSFGY